VKGFCLSRLKGISMLVLSRRKNQEIRIGDDIVLTIVDIRGDNVRIGITAPPGVAVHRQEVWDAVKKGNEDGT
jgi:carbon storage regulator